MGVREADAMAPVGGKAPDLATGVSSFTVACCRRSPRSRQPKGGGAVAAFRVGREWQLRRLGVIAAALSPLQADSARWRRILQVT
jgi:hypothetical protein